MGNEIGNSKSEALNPKQYQNPNDQNSKPYSLHRFDVKNKLFIGDVPCISSPLTGEDKGEGDGSRRLPPAEVGNIQQFDRILNK